MYVLEKQVVVFFFYWDSVIKSWSKDIYFKLLINDFFTAPIRHFGTVKFTFICYRYVDQNQFVQPVLFKGIKTFSKMTMTPFTWKKPCFYENRIKIIKCLSSTVKPFACRRGVFVGCRFFISCFIKWDVIFLIFGPFRQSMEKHMKCVNITGC